jgi:hypothetical protein
MGMRSKVFLGDSQFGEQDPQIAPISQMSLLQKQKISTQSRQGAKKMQNLRFAVSNYA